jgi:hypothetical protein
MYEESDDDDDDTGSNKKGEEEESSDDDDDFELRGGPLCFKKYESEAILSLCKLPSREQLP